MAQIKQIGPGRKTVGTIDGVTYVTRNGVTYARSAPNMPASAYNNPEAKLRQAIFKMIQMHLKYHLRTIKQTFTPKGNGSPSNRYFSENYKALRKALNTLAVNYVAGEIVTITDVESAICTFAAEHPKSIKIALKSGYQEVYLTGEWPSTITLNASAGDSTMIIIVAENGTTTTYNADGTVTVSGHTDSTESTENSGGGNTGGSSQSSGAGGTGSTNSGNNGGNSGNSGSVTPSTGGSGQAQTVTAPSFSGNTQFADSTLVTISGPDGATIHYTVDGSTPTAESTQYSEPLTFTETTTLKAIAIKDGVSSAVTSRTYTKGSNNGAGGQD